MTKQGDFKRDESGLDDAQVGVIGPEGWLLTFRLASVRQGRPK
jgi:hypothetical protein